MRKRPGHRVRLAVQEPLDGRLAGRVRVRATPTWCTPWRRIKSYLDYGMPQAIQIAGHHRAPGSAGHAWTRTSGDLSGSTRRARSTASPSAGPRVLEDREARSATMFVWAPLPGALPRASARSSSRSDCSEEAKVAVSPGVGFGPAGEGFVRFALVENRHRIRQAVRGIRRFLREATIEPRIGEDGHGGERQHVGVGLIGLGTIGTGVAKVLQAERRGDRGAPRLSAASGAHRRPRSRDRSRRRPLGVRFDSATPKELIDRPGRRHRDRADRRLRRGQARHPAGSSRRGSTWSPPTRRCSRSARLARSSPPPRQGGTSTSAFEASVGGRHPDPALAARGTLPPTASSSDAHGIVNGTTNYVLTEMEKGGEAYEVVLEARPGARLRRGRSHLRRRRDRRRPQAGDLLAAMAFGAELTFTTHIPTEGIRAHRRRSTSSWPPSSATGSSCSAVAKCRPRRRVAASASRRACSPP